MSPKCPPTDYVTLTYDVLDQLRHRRGYAKKESKSGVKPRLSTVDALDRKRARGTHGEVPDVAVNAIEKRNATEHLRPIKRR